MIKRMIFTLLVLVAGVAVVLAVRWVRNSPDLAVELLQGAGLGGSRSQQIVRLLGADLPLEDRSPEQLILHGTVEAEKVAIASGVPGRVQRLEAAKGMEIESGSTAIVLDSRELIARLAQLEAAVAAAEAEVAQVRAGVHPAEILAAEARLQQAAAEHDAAVVAHRDAQAIAENPQQIHLQVTQARVRVDLAAAEIERAKARIKSSEVERDRYRAQGTMEEKYLYRAYDYQVQAATAGLLAAQTELKGAMATLAKLEALRDHPLALLGQVHLAEAQRAMAEKGMAVAEARLAELRAGPIPEQVALAEAKVARAQASVEAMRVQIDQATLLSPISGTATDLLVSRGEAVQAGQILVLVADLDEVFLTVYVPEGWLGSVTAGQAMQVEVDSFPSEVFSGTVSYISPRAEFTPENAQTEEARVALVFAVRLTLPNPDHRLRPGMPADVYLSVP